MATLFRTLMDAITGKQLQTNATVQSPVLPSSFQLNRPEKLSFATIRKMRRQPTIALARDVMVSPVASGSWTIEAEDGTDNQLSDFIETQLFPLRQQIMLTAQYGGIDFGWQGFEKVFEVVDGVTVIAKLKPLLHDITAILIEAETGGFAGYTQTDPATNRSVIVPSESALHIPFRVEGTQWHGSSLLANALKPWNDWNASNDGAARYDQKIAGSHWHIQFPTGTSIKNSVKMDNSLIAKEFLESLMASGSIVSPKLQDGREFVTTLISDQNARQASFVPRLEYLDRQMVRALIMPERAALEGRFGTRADAKSHIDVAVTTMELIAVHITNIVNTDLVDQLLALNFGNDAKGKVRLKSVPIADVKLATIQDVYDRLLANPQSLLEEFGAIDTEAIKTQLGIPINAGVDESIPLPGEDVNANESMSLRSIYDDVSF